MHRYASGVVLLSAIVVSGCVINVSDEDGRYASRSIERQQLHNRDVISQLRLGVTIEHVRGELGEPDFSEVWDDEGEEVRVLRYRTHRTHSDGDTTADETTALVFRSGELVGIGERAVADN